MNARTIKSMITKATKNWTKQRKAEERANSHEYNRRRALLRGVKNSLKEAVYSVLSDAYLAVSNDNTLPAHARQIMYEVRRRIQKLTTETLDDKYFTQSLLPAYVDEHAYSSRNWNIVFDARGHLVEPHTRTQVALGTLGVNRYLQGVASSTRSSFKPEHLFPTHGPKLRYGAIMFIEKEGFSELLNKVQLAERYDIAVMSTKGLSTMASRRLVDEICGTYDIPLLILRDFDKAGFSIAATLTQSSSRYTFRHEIRAIDLGIRLQDVEEWNLEPESFILNGEREKTRANLLRNGATQEEAKFICGGKRVELNAFTSANFVKFIESKLNEHRIKKVTPDDDTLQIAFRRSLREQYIERHFEDLAREAEDFVEELNLPASLSHEVAELLDQDPSIPWDAAIRVMAGEELLTQECDCDD